ncbi:hypothetical protein DL96DRAFT_569187 [Flagelloscypha sp. PMI_526]|nr:hypothetical protein DL96DRAFT_569187 [Flagelloscypha sp. PMI_526]
MTSFLQIVKRYFCGQNARSNYFHSSSIPRRSNRPRLNKRLLTRVRHFRGMYLRSRPLLLSGRNHPNTVTLPYCSPSGRYCIVRPVPPKSTNQVLSSILLPQLLSFQPQIESSVATLRGSPRRQLSLEPDFEVEQSSNIPTLSIARYLRQQKDET